MKSKSLDFRFWLLCATLFTFSQSFTQVTTSGPGNDGSKTCELCDLSANQINVQPFKGCGFGFSLSSGLDAPCVRDHYVWDFGDGTQSSSNSSFAFHRFPGNGTYNVCGTVWAELNGEWCSSTLCISVTVTGCDNPCSDCSNTLAPPTVSHLTNCVKRFNVNSQANGSTCTAGDYTWDFGDGTVLNTSVSNPYHQYTASGVYTVCVTQSLTTANGQPCEITSCNTINVTNCDPQFSCSDCGISINPIQIWTLNNCRRGFTAGSNINGSNCTRTDVSWDFGDGTVITPPGSFVSHQYTMDGTYDVCLTVNAEHNVTGEMCSETRCTTITVTGCGTNIQIDQSGNKAIPTALDGKDISVFPNPIAAGERLNLTLSQSVEEIQLLDVTGRIILKQRTGGGADLNMNIPGDLSPGLYFVRSSKGEFKPVSIQIQHP